MEKRSEGSLRQSNLERGTVFALVAQQSRHKPIKREERGFD